MNPESPFNQGGQFPPQPTPPPTTPGGYQPMNGFPPQPQPQPSPQPQPQAGYTPLPPVQTPPLRRRPSKKWLILTFVFIFTTLVAAGLGVWALLNYFEQRDTVQSQVTAAVATEVKKQQDKDAADFFEKEKQPNRQFAGPDDLGSVSFDYPKTWSIYVASDGTKGTNYEAYFNPVSVPPVAKDQRYALRVIIEPKDTDAVLKTYETLIKKGDLNSTTTTTDGQTGTRLDGNFTKDIRGSAIIFRVRDKTVTVRTDAETFKADYDALIKTITFNK